MGKKNDNYTTTSWEVIESRDLIHDAPWIRLSVEKIRLPNGHVIDNFYQIQLPEYTAVVALTQDGKLVMERQYKHATRKTFLNLPSGYLAPNETPLECARREFMEETGYKSDSWNHLGSFVVDGNKGCGKMHAFAALNAYRSGEPYSDPSEDITVILMNPRDVFKKLFTGEIVTLGSAAALSLAFLSAQTNLGIHY